MPTMKQLPLFLYLASPVAAGPFKFFGTNEAGAEFAATVPGIPDKDFTFPNT
jgi:hypothetical protein